ncbi:MAG: GNAT family N-acetyltransferase [Anaerolineales bacterium]|nr:GNAT family N-acetyltransferase [Anaerolineales bacterium]
MRIEVKATNQLTREDNARIDCVVTSVLYPYLFGVQWSVPGWNVLVWEDGELVSHLGIVVREASVGGQPVRLGGVGHVATKVEWRKRGFASAAMQTAQAYLCEPLAVDFGLVMCNDEMVSYYEKFGWERVADSLLAEQQGRKKAFAYPVLTLQVNGGKWPPGEIDLCGLPW